MDASKAIDFTLTTYDGSGTATSLGGREFYSPPHVGEYIEQLDQHSQGTGVLWEIVAILHGDQVNGQHGSAGLIYVKSVSRDEFYARAKRLISG